MIMDFCKRYEGVQVTAEDAAFYLLKRTLAELSRGVIISRPTQVGSLGMVTFVTGGARWAAPMSEAVRIVSTSSNTVGARVLQSLAAVSTRRVSDVEAEYRATLTLIDDVLDRKPQSLELVRGLSVLRGAIATCLTVSSLCLAA